MMLLFGIIGVASLLDIASAGRPRISLAQLFRRKDSGVNTKRESGAHRLRRTVAAKTKGKHWATEGTTAGFSFGAIAHVSFKWLFAGSRPSDGVSREKELELHAWDAQESRIARLTGRHRASGVLAVA